MFERSKQDRIDFLREYSDDCGFSADQMEKEFIFENWCHAAQHFARVLSEDRFSHNCKYVELERQRALQHSISEKIILDSLQFNRNETFWGIDFEYASWEIFRVILEAFPEEQEVLLDYTNLYEGGWCEEFPKAELYDVPKTVVLTEGKYDAFVISKSMHLQYPYMSKFFSFMDFSVANVQGSTNFLTHYLKAFIGAKIENRIVALYDNDAAGLSEIKSLEAIPLPKNVRLMHLPNIELCVAYPTIGPTVNEDADLMEEPVQSNYF